MKECVENIKDNEFQVNHEKEKINIKKIDYSDFIKAYISNQVGDKIVAYIYNKNHKKIDELKNEVIVDILDSYFFSVEHGDCGFSKKNKESLAMCASSSKNITMITRCPYMDDEEKMILEELESNDSNMKLVDIFVDASNYYD